MRYLALFTLSVLFIFGCKDDDKVVNPAEPEISSVSAPLFLLCNVESLYTFSVRVENLEEIDSVMCLVTRPDGSDEFPFRLFDDAGQLDLNVPAYASEHSGDVVANNGTYTRGVWSHLLCDGETGEYTFQFDAIKGAAHLVGGAFTVDVRTPQACTIVSSNHPSSFGLCFTPVTFIAEVDEDPAVPLDTVIVTLQSGDTVLWHQFMERTSATTWDLNVTPSIFGCTPTGASYTLRYEAYDRFGLSCSAEYPNILFINGLPEVSNSLLPDTMYRPESASDSNIYEMFVDVSDCEIEGWSVTQAARFDVRREDQDWSPTSPADFFLRDDGVPPDDVRGDGTASSFLKVTNNGRIDDLYFFRYYAIDCASGDTSDYWMDSTRIVLEGLSALGTVETTDLGLSTQK